MNKILKRLIETLSDFVITTNNILQNLLFKSESILEFKKQKQHI